MSFVVLKFGGTSVSSLSNWRNVTAVVRARQAEGLRVVVVHSAVSKVTDTLERLLLGAVEGQGEVHLRALEQRHAALCAELGIQLPSSVAARLAELRQIAEGLTLLGEASDRVRARVLASGERMATAIGADFLRSQGISTTLVDATEVLRADERRSARAGWLNATCDFEPDAALQDRFRAMDGVVLTQGFVAADARGDTVILGRGGSDTSGAYIAAKLQAARLEIWTDVPGMFTANPRDVPSARLLRRLHYDEAQEIASGGAKVLHPRCILPVRQAGIPLQVFATPTPEMEGTEISASPPDDGARVKSIALKKGITLISMESPGMWHEVGFLADAFAVFKAQGLSVDLISTSETNVTVSLDPQANALDAQALERLLAQLAPICRSRVIGPCASLSLVGRNIRAILHRLGPALELFEEQPVHLLSQAANDLNLTLVIDEDQGDRLVNQLHDLLIRPRPDDPVIGPTWEQLQGPAQAPALRRAWWHERRAELLSALGDADAAYVYDGATLDAQVAALGAMRGVDRVFYAMKANWNPEILRRFAAAGLGFECVSPGEIAWLRAAVPELNPARILFTPNFAPRHEVEAALEQGIRTTVDNLHCLQKWPEIFRDRPIFLRIDTGRAHGHHAKVRTGGVHSKFGIPLFELEELKRAITNCDARVVGLHCHAGSGAFELDTWLHTAETLATLAEHFPEVDTLDIGGGLGVPERRDRPTVDLAALDAALLRFRAAHPRFRIWMEPGRFLVAGAGVILARVTQRKGKGELQYVGVATGMNTLIRPALYGAFHEIVNLSRLDEVPSEIVEVVGPICESGDVLGHARHLPRTEEGDVLLIANAGAYGRSMASTYNLREPASERII